MTEKNTQHNSARDATILSCIPIARGIGTEELSYFTLKRVEIGSLISVPVRSRTVSAIVVETREASGSKAELKSLPFGLKKAGSVKARALLSPAFINAARETARYFSATTGAALSVLTPASLGTDLHGPETAIKETGTGATGPAHAPKHLPLLIQTTDEERVAAYRGIIREEFARGGSVFVCLPEIAEIERLAETLSRGIVEYTFVLHSGLPRKHLAASWARAISETHPVLIVGTGQFLSIPRSGVHTIIVEKESSRAYKAPARPMVDIRTFAEIFARATGARLIFGDTFIRPETLARIEGGDATEFSPLVFRALSTAERTLVDMRAKEECGEKTYAVIGETLRNALEQTMSESGHAVLLTARRGLYPITLCNDCGSVVLCKRCSAPMTLHGLPAEVSAQAGASAQAGDASFKKGVKNFFLCHKCGTREESSDACAVCGGWKFALLGAGAERVEKVIKEMFPDAPMFRIDRDTVKTHKKALFLRDAFYQTPGAILIGTEMAISYCDREVECAAAASVDSLFTIPDFRINERVFSLLMRLRARARKRFLIQTRDQENRVLRYALDGNMVDFYREEIAERKVFGYPPFATLIKIAREGSERGVRADMEALAKQETLAVYEPRAYESFTRTGKSGFRMNLLLKIPNKKWVDETLLTTLRALPPHYAITVDPESLL